MSSQDPPEKKSKFDPNLFLTGLSIHLHPAALSKNRKAILERQICSKGGGLVAELKQNSKKGPLIVLIDDSLMDKARIQAGLVTNSILFC